MPFTYAYNLKFGYRPALQNNVGLSDGCSNAGGAGPSGTWPDSWAALTSNLGSMDVHTYGGDGTLSIRPSGPTYADVSSGQDQNDQVDKVANHSVHCT